MNRAFVAGVASAVLIGGCRSAESPQQAPQDPREAGKACVAAYFEAQTKDQIAASLSTKSAALALANTVNIPSVTEVANFITLHEAFQPGTVRPGDIPVMTVEESTPSTCDPLEYYRQQAAFGVFMHEINAVLQTHDPAQPLSEFSKGIIMLHESQHAKNFSENRQDPYEERDTRVFEQQILDSVGGKSYETYRKLLRQRIKDAGFVEANASGAPINITELINSVTEADMGRLFGKTTSEQDYHIKRTGVLLHSFFEVIAEITPADQVARAQEDFMKGIGPQPSK